MTEPYLHYCPHPSVAALRAVLADWHATHPELTLLVLVPEREADAVPGLQALCRELGITLAGAIFPALVVAERFVSEGMWLMAQPGRLPVGLMPLTSGCEPFAEQVRAWLPAVDEDGAGSGTLFMVFDAMLPNIATLLDDLYLRLADQVHYAGVNAGSETFQPMPCVFDAHRCLGQAVLCVLLPGHPGVVLEHGYQAPEDMITATSTEGNRIYHIDWLPAFDVYRDRIRAACGIELTRDNFYQYACHFPFGILLANDEVVVRIPVALEDDGSLFCVGEVSANAMLALLQSPDIGSTDTIDRLDRLLRALCAPIGGLSTLLTFYCAGRRMHMGQGAEQELQALHDRSAAVIQAGALSLGEIGSRHTLGYPLFHNATLVCMPWLPLPIANAS